jgi:hypothetical protein
MKMNMKCEEETIWGTDGIGIFQKCASRNWGERQEFWTTISDDHTYMCECAHISEKLEPIFYSFYAFRSAELAQR